MNDLRRKFLKGNLISAWIVLSLVAAAYLLPRFGQDVGILDKKMSFPWEWSRPIENAIDESLPLLPLLFETELPPAPTVIVYVPVVSHDSDVPLSGIGP